MNIYFDNGLNPFTNIMKEEGFQSISPYNNHFKVKMIRLLEKNSIFEDVIYNKIPLADDEKIIVFDSNISKEYLLWVKKKYHNHRIIFWYWNPVHASISPSDIPKEIEIWSYSPNDCEQYSLKRNTTFYFSNYANRIKKKDKIGKEIKAVFIGAEKGRMQMILQLKEELERNGVDCEICILGESGEPNESLNNGIEYKKFLTYEDVVNKIIDADIIMDLYTDINSGISLRPMEAIFFNKKLITNNKTIYDYDFYDSNRVYVINESRNLHEFLSIKPSSEVSNLQEYYSMSSWYDRFDYM